ncbi:MAG: protein kinase [Thermoleophilaceae bacterium]
MSDDPRIGSQLAGYRIERLLGRGGMGVVYLAEQLALGRSVALKLIAPDLAQDEGFRERFQRESRLAASIDHPNVIPVHEAGEADGQLFISMRFVEGIDLRELIAGGGRIEALRAARIVAQVGAALDAAHARGLVHRDVKPANVLIDREDHAYLSDFGLTKSMASASGLTATGQWVGTLDYIAPEQIQGEAVDARTDVYALGCVLHQALTGNVPYPRDSDPAKLWAHMNEPPPAVSESAPGLPGSFDGVVARAMAKDPAERFPSAGDLGRATVAAAEGRAAAEPERSVAAGAAAPGEITVPRGRPAPTAAAGPPTAATAALRHRRPGGRGRWFALGGAGAVVLAGGAALALALGSGDEDPEPGPAPGPETVTVERTTETETEAQTEADAAPTDLTTHTAEGYTARYPAGWAVEIDDELQTTFRRSRFTSPGGDAFVSIDRSPGETTDPADKAAEVERALRGSPGYERISFEPVTIAGEPAFEWTFFTDDGGTRERRIDLFLNRGGDSYAVLGGGADFGLALPAARRVAGSIEPR